MFVVKIICDKEHTFEGWYDTPKDYYSLSWKGEVCCPQCGSKQLKRKSLAQNPAPVGARVVDKPFSALHNFQNLNKKTLPTSADSLTAREERAIAHILDKIRAINLGTQPIKRRSKPKNIIAQIASITSESRSKNFSRDEEGQPYFKTNNDLDKN